MDNKIQKDYHRFSPMSKKDPKTQTPFPTTA